MPADVESWQFDSIFEKQTTLDGDGSGLSHHHRRRFAAGFDLAEILRGKIQHRTGIDVSSERE